MNDEMRSDAELLDDLLSAAPFTCGGTKVLTAKLIAHWTGLSVQTISDYRVGKTNIPADFWRRVLEHHPDLRIVALFIPDRYSVELVDNSLYARQRPADFFRAALEAERQHHETSAYLCDVIADGRVDETDDQRIADYRRSYQEHRLREASLHHGIISAYATAQAAKGER